jgi:hypothetical protein
LGLVIQTAYLPGRKKPVEFGLPYDYPRDYFLQHVQAVKRIDERKLVRRFPWFRAYYHSRQRLMARMPGGQALRKKGKRQADGVAGGQWRQGRV